jgi:hypothetical protein
VMADGRVAEAGSPHELLTRAPDAASSGAATFASLVAETGPRTAAMLTQAAAEADARRKEKTATA